MFKQLLLRPLSMHVDDEMPMDLRMIHTFRPLCAPPEGAQQDLADAGSVAFSRQWVALQDEQRRDAARAMDRLLARFEWQSLWETDEVHQELYKLYVDEKKAKEEEEEAQEEGDGGIDPE